jgi:hypothetical protein
VACASISSAAACGQDRFRLALLWKPLRHQAGRLRHRFDDVPVA